MRAGEQFIASVYSAIRNNPKLWPNTALLVVYDEHGGIYDHVPPPSCTPDSPLSRSLAQRALRIRSISIDLECESQPF